ncbi:Alstrom syndrome protein 1 homolog isoform X2 [Gouania willdenowi]|uniref:Alstrom syndrome protein 1 homolog isoform X2 n=1 Tax=Gouania willdenowi TaxID=441366 RepID=UPI001055E5F0|nr:Alstrom syndrome protein 1 homolog isoform X2 [Gouania willdenowi]
MTTMPADPAQSVTSSAAVQGDTDQEVMSEGSSQSSLALRVAKLLQDESPATMMSSTPSLTDNERKASEGIKLKISGEQFGPLHLDEKDKSKIEEIKRELLFKNPLKSLPSTDTESSSTSSSRVRSLHGPSSSAETYAAKRPGNVFLSQPQQSPIVDLTETSTQVQTQLQTDLEDIVCEIASREGVRIPTKNPRALTSITIATCRRSASSSPSTSPTAFSLTPELLHLTELSSDQPTAAHIQLQSKEERSTQTNGLFGPPLTTEDQNVTSLSAVEGLTRQETVGGQSAPSSQVSDGEHVQNERAQASRNIEKTTQTHQSSSATAGHVSHVHLTLSPKHHQTLTSDLSRSPNVAPLLPHRDSVPPRHSSSRGSSPDEGVGSSSPQEWSDAREPARLQASGRTTMFQSAAPLRTATGMSTIPHRAEKSLRGPAAETPVPLLPYKPRGSEQLFYVPQTEADVSSTETTMESSHSGSDDAVPPRFSSDVLGHRDPGLDRGVTIRHTEGIYSKRLKTTTFKMQDPPSRDAAVAEDETSSTSVSSEIHQEALSRDQGTSPIPEPASQQSRLDLLWQKFCEQWAAEQSRPTSDREASLLERLERLSRLINRSSAGRLRDRREEDGSEPWSRGGTQHRRTTRNTEVQGNKGLKLRLHKEETSQSTSSSISQSTDARSSMSTVDTARLIRAYGAHKVQHLKSSSSLRKLYSIINKQREEEESRSNDDIITIAPSESTNKSAVVDSTSSTSTYEVPAHRGPSTMLLTAKRAVNKSIQAGDLELVSNGTRRHTRDVGTTFPSPATSRASEQSSTPPSSVTRGRGARRSPSKSQSVHRQRKNKRSPGKAYPAGVSWFIRADYLRSDARKENREEDEERPTHTMNGAWFEPYSPVGSWREPLRQKQIHQDINEQHHHHHHPPDQRTKPVSTGLSPVSLQEALETQRPDFILHSRQRLKRLALRAEERRQQMPFSLLEREQLLLHRMGGWERLPKPAGCDSLRRAVPRKEMIQRSKQIYENLPEVQRRREEEKRKAEYRWNRLNAQLYNKRITNRVLGKKLAWH